MWNFKGNKRPPFAEAPADGQESVWDYPRPPRLLADVRLVDVKSQEQSIARSNRTYRICETASPPTFYIPPDDIEWGMLCAVAGGSYCEWKGAANHWGLHSKPEAGPVGWSYRKPRAPFLKIKNYISFYPGRVDCFVGGERVRPQPGGFYGGWPCSHPATSDSASPFLQPALQAKDQSQQSRQT